MRRTTTAVVLLALVAPASAQETAPSPAPETAPEAVPEEAAARKKDKADKAKGKGGGTPDILAVAGRVYVRETLTGVELAGDSTWLDERTIDNARVTVSFRPNKRTRMDIEVDFAGDQAELKDTFIRYRPIERLDLVAGRFKRPVSFIGLTSTWDLPRIDRGLLSELRVEGRRLMFAGGRGDGVMAELELPGALRPQLSLVMHESDLADDLGLPVTDVNQDVFARAELEPILGLHLAVAGGAVGSLRSFGDRTTYRHRPFGTLEAYLETAPLRVWAEVMAGRNASTFVAGEQLGDFLAAQALVSPRVEPLGGLRALEPFAAVAWLEPSTEQARDRVTEVTGGAALWITGKLRLQLEGGRRMAQGPLAPSIDATIVRVQLGAAFDTKVELP